MASVTFTLPSSLYDPLPGGTVSRWTPAEGQRPTIPSSLAEGSDDVFMARLQLPRTVSLGIVLSLHDSQTGGGAGQGVGPDLSTAFETEGSIALVASDGTSVICFGPDHPSSVIVYVGEPYDWRPANLADVASFINAVDSLVDHSLTVTLDDNQNAAPVVSGVSANPNIVSANGTIALSGTATDPDAVPDTLALQWTANPNIGNFSAPTSLSTNWTAPGPADNDREISVHTNGH